MKLKIKKPQLTLYSYCVTCSIPHPAFVITLLLIKSNLLIFHSILTSKIDLSVTIGVPARSFLYGRWYSARLDTFPKHMYYVTSGVYIMQNNTVCQGSSAPFYIVIYYINWVPSSWTYSSSYLNGHTKISRSVFAAAKLSVPSALNNILS